MFVLVINAFAHNAFCINIVTGEFDIAMDSKVLCDTKEPEGKYNIQNKVEILRFLFIKKT
ncbi:hypothetical protein RhiirA5_440965 [Rhizophagus irregularis]|uniref:Uncharacterized protein n=1 Tax=Rhizophagus irregularis TaxID=588596 RepID=A0A2N0NG58_9GLOM|nr:hypothetical protein RhiirA5_440965 [Rhizophagus irregularis]